MGFRQLFLIIMLTSIPLFGFAQIALSGKVVTAHGNSPIAYVNIGILDTDVGTISDQDGSFSITIPEQHRKSRLLFSALGYKRLFLAVDPAQNPENMIVRLEEEALQLQAITVIGEQFRRKFQFGNENSEGGTVYADTLTAGSAMALLIENTGNVMGLKYQRFKFPAFVERVSVRVAKNTFREFKMRVRLYSVDSVTGMPGKDILHKSVVATSKIKKGWLETDLAEHAIVVNGPFYLAFEWILEKKDRQYLHRQYYDWLEQHPQLVSLDYSVVDGDRIPYVNYNARFWAGTSLGIAVSRRVLEQFKCYYRYTSFSQWTRSSSILAATITLRN